MSDANIEQVGIQKLLPTLDQYAGDMERQLASMPNRIRTLKIRQLVEEAIADQPRIVSDTAGNQKNQMAKSNSADCQCAEKPEKDKKNEPEFPGADGDVGDYIVWLDFWTSVKGKIPDKFDWPSIRDEARNALIRQGIKRIKKWLETQAADLVEEILKTPAEAVIDDITKDAAQDLLDGGFGSLQKLWEKFTWDIILKGLEDELGKQLLKGLEKGLEDGAEAGLEAMFDALGWDYENSPAAMVGMEFSKYLAKQMVDELMSGVKGLDDLINSFESLQKRLSKKIQDFFNGKPLESGKATLPVARLTDKDNLTDFVITGLPTVLVCGQPIARISDMLFPSGKPVIQGSAIIEAGGLPIARETSGTAVPSQLTRSQSTVLAEGITSWTMMPGGEMICGFPNAVGGNMSLMPSSETTQTSSKRTLPDGKIYDSVQKTVTDPDTGKVQSIPNDARFDPESNSFYQLSRTPRLVQSRQQI